MNIISAKFTVIGKVQGVGYRFFVYNHAIELNLNGYAKNLFDGCVEVIVEGEISKIDILHELLKVGPSRSHVKKINFEYNEEIKKLKGFKIY